MTRFQYFIFLYIDSQFMCRLAPLIGNKLVEKLFLKRYLDLCEDNDMMVRRTCATHFGEMCIAVGKETLIGKLVSLIRISGGGREREMKYN